MTATAKIIPLRQGVTKRCPACGETKTAAEFYAAKARPDGCSSYCKPCDTRLRAPRAEKVRAYNRKWQRRKYESFTPDEKYDQTKKRFERHLWRTHGIRIADARALLAKQGGLCGIRACGKELSLDVHGRKDSANRAVIDHCHQTGRVRGLLCNRCNKAEGFYTQNKNLFLGIAEYLERSSVA